jgi:hypothetical protein
MNTTLVDPPAVAEPAYFCCRDVGLDHRTGH